MGFTRIFQGRGEGEGDRAHFVGTFGRFVKSRTFKLLFECKIVRLI